jgi:hypothetical protein
VTQHNAGIRRPRASDRPLFHPNVATIDPARVEKGSVHSPRNISDDEPIEVIGGLYAVLDPA